MTHFDGYILYYSTESDGLNLLTLLIFL